MEPHSSTSSSEQAVPPPTARLTVLAFAVAGALVLLAGWELALRFMGTVPDAAIRPGRQAANVFLVAPEPGRNRLVMLGSSRVGNGFSPVMASREVGERFDVRNCSLPMASSAQMLEAVAAELSPGDVVVCEVWPIGFYEDRSAPDFPEFADQFGSAWALSRQERVVSQRLSASLLALSPKGDPMNHLRMQLRAGLVGTNPEVLDAKDARFIDHDDGWREAVLVDLDPENWKRRADAHAPAPSGLTPRQRLHRFERLLARLTDLVAQLEARDVTVLFVRMPSSGAYFRMEETTFPREQYWSRLDAAFPGRCLHFADDPEMRRLWTPDGSHLESSGARAFSQRLGTWVRQKLETPRPPLDP